ARGHLPEHVVVQPRPPPERARLQPHEPVAQAEAVRPLEVVHQRPDEERVDVAAGGAGLQRRAEVRDEERRAPLVGYAARGVGLVGARRPALGHRHARVAVLVPQALEGGAQAGRVDLPPRGGDLGAARGLGEREPEGALWVGAHAQARVVVHPEHAWATGRHLIEVALAHEGLEHPRQRLRVAAPEEGVEERADERRVGQRRGGLVVLALVGRLPGLDHLNRGHLGLGQGLAQPRRRQARGEVPVVPRAEEGLQVAEAGGVTPGQVTEDGVHVGFVEHERAPDAPREQLGHDLGVVGEVVGRVAPAPAAPLLQGLRQVPVVEARPRLQAAGEDLVEHPVVDGQGLAPRPALPFGHHARPAQREAVGPGAEAGRQVEVLLHPPQVVGGDRPLLGRELTAGQEAVPHRLAASRSPLGLEGRGRDAEAESAGDLQFCTRVHDTTLAEGRGRGTIGSVTQANGDPARGTVYLVLAGALVAVSFAAVFIRLADAPAPVVALYRLAIATLVLLPAPLRARAGTPPRGRAAWLTALSGLALAVHFGTWIQSLSYTTIAASVTLATTTPLWTALLAWFVFGATPTLSVMIGMTVAIAGAAVIGFGDLSGGTNPVLGDLLALCAAAAAAVYFLVGREVMRGGVSLSAYVGTVYAWAA